ncbi:MAG TPA: rhomboid family intramembrane serine protease [Polyangiaceae bacterium]
MSNDSPSPPRSEWLGQVPVTRALLALNVGMFVVEVAITHLFTDIPSDKALELGASYALATVGENRWETLVTACFLHGGVVHLALNMVFLWLAGPVVERAVGSARMAPMYLAAGAFGNVLSVAYYWYARSGTFGVGASGAISGVLAAALVVGWRLQGWKGPLTQAMVRWLGFMIVLSVASKLAGGSIDNATHLGGALAGAVIAGMWRRGHRYSDRATRAILAACVGVLVACIVIVGVHDRTDPFARMTLLDRFRFTNEALADGRCRDAHDGLRAVERLRERLAPVTSLRNQVEAMCGHVDGE